ncbi:hypothetical protein GCM10022226_75740 [Sphaerisporangium flaviroseum]|uniref:SCP domain-containing protein n=1 Tax=Sphaerisporangium flaviroseum TaxID=509199 RepID=A0ABP7JFC6_9ACTN
MGLLACLTAALLAALVVSGLETPKTADEIYLSPRTPAPKPARVLAAPEPLAKRPALGHVAKPPTRVKSETEPRSTTSVAKKRSSIDGFSSTLPPGTSVGTASGADEAGTEDQDAPPTGDLEAMAVDLTNRERMRKGCAPLRVDLRLARSARAHSRDMAAKNYFGHTSRDGLSPWDRMARAGYSNSAAENIARGYQSADEAVRGWMANTGHRRNILNCQITTVGVGVAYGSGDTWWTQDFGYS